MAAAFATVPVDGTFAPSPSWKQSTKAQQRQPVNDTGIAHSALGESVVASQPVEAAAVEAMGRVVRQTSQPRWLWPGIDQRTGVVGADGLGTPQDDVG